MIQEYNSEELIEFYSDNGLEIDHEHSYLGTNLTSLALIQDNKIIAAITLSKYKNQDFLEAIAVLPKYRNQGLSNKLFKEITKDIKGTLYTISKNDDYYIKKKWQTITNEEMISDNCKTCSEYKTTCYPTVMKIEL